MAAAAWDPEAPSVARVWNKWLGGTDYGSADERLAAAIEEACPAMPQMAREARLFSARVTAWAAAEGIGQVIELGCGLPHGPGIHVTARSVRPGSRVAYVDSDPAVTDELGGLLGDEERDGIAVVCGDLTRPCALVKDARLRSVIDPGEPCCLLAVGVLHMMTPRRARSVMGSWASLLAPGSVVAVTAPVVVSDLMRERLARVHLPGARYDVSPQAFAGWLGGLDLVDPGVCAAVHLRPGWQDAPEVPHGAAHVIAAIGRKA
jgi:O-methyltransferase involved in polyketide biosynthesis